MADVEQLPNPKIEQVAVERYEHDAPANAVAIRSIEDITKVSKIFVHSGMFKGDRGLTTEQQVYQAVVKVMAGVEFGIQPFAAMRGINIINGNAEMSANLMAAKVKSHLKYDYKVLKLEDDGCELMFYEIPYPGAKRSEWDELGPSTFSIEDARRAGLVGGNWSKFPRNMCFARAISNGVRIHCPDIFYGAPVYVEGEISSEVSPKTVADAAPTATPARELPAKEAKVVVDDLAQEPPQDEPVASSEPPAVKPGSLISTAQMGKIHILSNEKGLTERIDRQQFISQVIDRDVESSKELTKDEARRVIDALDEYEGGEDANQS
jgi:hypothetical protein